MVLLVVCVMVFQTDQHRTASAKVSASELPHLPIHVEEWECY
jgi:hypothetical protein